MEDFVPDERPVFPGLIAPPFVLITLESLPLPSVHDIAVGRKVLGPEQRHLGGAVHPDLGRQEPAHDVPRRMGLASADRGAQLRAVNPAGVDVEGGQRVELVPG